MPVKTTTTRKRRSRKSTAKVSTTAQRIAAAVDKQEAKIEPKVTTTPKPVVVKQEVKSSPKVTTTPKPVVVKEVKIAPPSPKLSLRDYREDLQSRIAIHNYEVNNLINDFQKGYNYFLPFGKKAYNFVTNLSAK